ncbi:YheV family putative zinc ribbon protein [Thaumasiovibrio subtropicus]|uniref:YheV family putative zinc ribbon protein n=1 Tax=Thaumasiovibrio subtropicus TaxID=1891207 RepID=UPI000B355DCE|nr:YheV family putative zinc ribbon protein [Thaumasiovibrio subtropicus]
MTKKRFIAGAKCPACQATDTLRWWVENNIEHVECVACQHQDQRLPKSVEQETANNKGAMIGVFKPD